jgi:hypothetical protein
MKFLTLLFLLAALALGLVLLAPVVGLIAALAVPLGGLIIWLFPIVIIACSDKTTGGEKAAWILGVVFLSWFTWVFYFLLAPLKRRPEYERYSDHRRYRYR